MKMKRAMTAILTLAAGGAAATVRAAPQVYTIEPMHTYPSFKASHMGISFWRGKFDHSSGTIVLDRARGTGRIDVTIDPGSVDFGLAALNQAAKGPELFDVAKFPTAKYESASIRFKDGVPVAANGRLTLHGVTRPVPLSIRSFKCITNPFFKRQVCGADVTAKFERTKFGMTQYAEDPWVYLYIQVEAVEGTSVPAETPPPAAPARGG
ncbi:MAG: YceI family protein [Steroidobacteraceae bacterium]